MAHCPARCPLLTAYVGVNHSSIFVLGFDVRLDICPIQDVWDPLCPDQLPDAPVVPRPAPGRWRLWSWQLQLDTPPSPQLGARAPRAGLGARIYTTMLVFTCPDTCAAAGSGTRYRYCYSCTMVYA